MTDLPLDSNHTNGLNDDESNVIFGWSDKIKGIGIGRQPKDSSIEQQRTKDFIAYYNEFKKNGIAKGTPPSLVNEPADDILCLYVSCSPDELKNDKIPTHFEHNSKTLPVVIRGFSGLPSDQNVVQRGQ